MEFWHIWAILAIVLAIGEILTSGFALIFFAIGAVGGAIGAAAGACIEWQLGIFAILSLLSFLILRPILMKFSSKGEVPTNADALIGRVATVTECIEVGGKGRVAIDGDIWQAVSHEQNDICEGEKVVVLSRESIVLTVGRK